MMNIREMLNEVKNEYNNMSHTEVADCLVSMSDFTYNDVSDMSRSEIIDHLMSIEETCAFE